MMKKLGILLLLLSFLAPTAVQAVSGDGDIPEARPTMCTSSGLTIYEETGEARDVSGDIDAEFDLLLQLVIQTLVLLP